MLNKRQSKKLAKYEAIWNGDYIDEHYEFEVGDLKSVNKVDRDLNRQLLHLHQVHMLKFASKLKSKRHFVNQLVKYTRDYQKPYVKLGVNSLDFLFDLQVVALDLISTHFHHATDLKGHSSLGTTGYNLLKPYLSFIFEVEGDESYKQALEQATVDYFTDFLSEAYYLILNQEVKLNLVRKVEEVD